MNKQRYTRNVPVKQFTAMQDYDAGTFIFVVSGAPTTILGNVYVNYVIELNTPQPHDSQGTQEEFFK